MPEMKVQPSGGIVFSLTAEERENKERRELLEKELEEVTKLKNELKDIIETLKTNNKVGGNIG